MKIKKRNIIRIGFIYPIIILAGSITPLVEINSEYEVRGSLYPSLKKAIIKRRKLNIANNREIITTSNKGLPNLSTIYNNGKPLNSFINADKKVEKIEKANFNKKFKKIKKSIIINNQLSNNKSKVLRKIMVETDNGDFYLGVNKKGLMVSKNGSNKFLDVPGVDINDWSGASILKTSTGDIYLMASNSKLKFLKKGAKAFIDARGSNIIDGKDGLLFESAAGDIYAAGSGTSLQVLKKYSEEFVDASGSKIKNGYKAVIFESSTGDIYAMSGGTRLEVLKNGSTSFTKAPGTIIDDGYHGSIFESSTGDIYAMGSVIPVLSFEDGEIKNKSFKTLQVLKKGASKFIEAPGTKITNGRDGKILESSTGDIYAMGNNSTLEVLKKGSKAFIKAAGSNIIDGADGVLFESSTGDIYAGGSKTRLQVLKKGSKVFSNVSGSKIYDGYKAVIFESSTGDIYTTGLLTPLQVLKKDSKGFVDASGSRLFKGSGANIFESSNGDIYANEKGTDWEVLKKGKKLFVSFKIINDQAIIDGIKKEELILPKVDNSKFPSTVNKPGPQSINGAIVSFTNWQGEDENGIINWTVSITKGEGKTKIFGGTLSGYQTTAQAKRIADQKIIDSIKKEELNLPSIHKNGKLPSSIIKPSSYFLRGASITFEKWIPNDIDRTIKWEAKITKRNLSKKINGYIRVNIPWSNNKSKELRKIILETDNGDIYVRGDQKGLKVLKNGSNKFLDVPGVDINDWSGASILKTSTGDIYLMASNSKFKFLKKGSKAFIDAPGSNIIDGKDGLLFESAAGDIYAAGFGSHLQVLKRNTDAFVDVKSSNIKEGRYARVLETTTGDIYVMGKGSGLQVLKNGSKSFIKALGAKITDGDHGSILESAAGDIYAAGFGTHLQVLKKGAEAFVKAPESNDAGGFDSSIFESSTGDIYAMGTSRKLKVLKKGAPAFTKTSSSRITDGNEASIFESSVGDIYVMGSISELRVLKKGSKVFSNVPGSEIINGLGGVIFESSNGDVYAMGNNSTLQVLKRGSNIFIDADGSNIVDGNGGIIFESSNGDIYAKGKGTDLQVLRKNKKIFVSLKILEIKKELILPKVDNSKLPSSLNKPGPQSINGAIVSFTNWQAEDENGTINWSVSIIKGEDETKIFGGTLSGYQTTAQAKRIADQKIIDSIKKEELNLPSIHKNGKLPSSIIKPSSYFLRGALITFEKWIPNDIYRKIKWEAKITKGNLSKKINGYIRIVVPWSNIGRKELRKIILETDNGDIYVRGDQKGLKVLKNGSNKFLDVPGVDINDWSGASILKTFTGDIYLMASNSKLKFLKKGAKAFIDAPGSNIIDGKDGFIFESSTGDIYAMGSSTHLQFLKKGTNAFVSAPGSKIVDGHGGVIFESPTTGDIYAMGYRSGLEVLRKNASKFIEVPKNIITNGAFGSIFESSTGDIYVIGLDSALQVLKKGASSFTKALGAHVFGGINKLIFESSIGDIYFMGNLKVPQVLTKGASSFTRASGLNINDGYKGSIFESSTGDIYVMGNNSALHVLKRGGSSFTKILGSNITYGTPGSIFESSTGDIYVMGKGTGLKVLKKGANIFIDAAGSNIVDGSDGIIFESLNGDIYTKGKETDLQVLKKGEKLFYSLKIDEIKKDFQLLHKKTSLFPYRRNILPSLLKRSPLGIGFIVPNLKDTIVTYTTVPDNINGSTAVTAHIKDGTKKSFYTTFTILGFKTSAQQAKQDVAAAKSAISNISGVSKSVNSNIKAISRATSFNSAALATLGSGGTFPQIPSGVVLTYTHPAINNDGTLTVTVSITKGSATDNASFNIVVSGIDTAKAKAANAAITKDKALFASFSQTVSGRPIPIINGNITEEILNGLTGHQALPTTTSGVTRILSINTNNKTGIATVTVTMSAPKGVTQSITYTIGGFKTADEILVDEVLALFNTLKNTTKGTTTVLNNAEKILPNSLINVSTANALGFVDPSANRLNETTVSFKAKNPNNAIGTLDVEGKINKGNITKSVLFKLKGFQTSAQRLTATADAIQSANLASLKNALKGGVVAKTKDKATDIANRINNIATLKSELGIDLSNLLTSSTYAINATGKANGQITVSVIMTTPNASTLLSNAQTIQFNHTSDAQLAKNTADQDIAALKALFDKLNNKNSSLSSKGKTLPAALENTPAAIANTPAAIGFIEPSLNNATVTYTIVPNNANGNIAVTAHITKGAGTSVDTTFNINGFKTSAQQAKQDVAAAKTAIDNISGLSKSINSNIKAISRATSFNSTALATLGSGGTFPQIPSGVVLTYTHPAINNDGTLTVTISITKGSATDNASFNIVVSGIDAAKAKAANAAITKDKALFASFSQTVSGRPIPIINGTTTEEILNGLTGHQSLPTTTSGVTRILSINTNNKTGIATVTVTMSAPKGVTQSITYTIGGFKTADEILVDEVLALFNTLKNTTKGTTTVLNNAEKILPNSLINVSTANALGFVDPSANRLNETTVSFKVKNPNNAIGTLDVEGKINKGNITKSVLFKLKGFQTSAQRLTATADAIQSANLASLKNALKGGVVAKTKDKATDIANRINNIATLKSELGIDLSNLLTSSTYAINATGKANGQITVSVEMNTPRATTPKSLVQTLEVNHKSNKKNKTKKLTIANEIEKIINFTFSHEKQKMPSEVSASIQDHITLEAFTGVKLPVIPKENERIKIVAEHNNEEGKLNLRIKIIPTGVDEKNVKAIEKEVFGFTTQGQRANANRIIESIKTRIKNKLHQSSILKNVQQIYASSLKSETNPIKIGFNSLNVPKGIQISYRLVKANDSKGMATIRATIKKRYGKTQIVDFNLKGYKKSFGKISKAAIILISAGGVCILGTLILLFKTLLKKSSKSKYKNV